METDIPLSQLKPTDDEVKQEASVQEELDWESIDFGFTHKIIKKIFEFLGGSNTAGQMMDDFKKLQFNIICCLFRYFPPVLPHPRSDLPLL